MSNDGQTAKNDKIKGVIQLILVVAFVGGSLLISSFLQAKKADITTNEGEERSLFVETKSIQNKSYRIIFDVTGNIDVRARVNIVPQVSGQVVKTNEAFFEGGNFKAGETLFEIDPRDYDFEIRRLNADISRARTALELEQAESKAAIAEWQQFKGNIPAPDLVARKPQMAEAKAALNAAQAQLSDAKLNRERTQFTLPFDGRVLSSMIEKGQYVSAGQNYGSVFDASTLEVSAALPAQQLQWLLDAQNPEIQIITNQAGREQTFEGVLKRGASAFDNQTRFASVNFGFTQAPENLLPGTFVTVRILGPKLDNVATIPAAALQKDGHIFIVKDDNTLHAITPEIAYQDGKELAVSNIGNDQAPVRVVISRVSGASEGAVVNFKEAKDAQQTPTLSLPPTEAPNAPSMQEFPNE